MADLTPWAHQKLSSSALSPAVIGMLCTAHDNGGLPYSEAPQRKGSAADSSGILLPYWTPAGQQVEVTPTDAETDPKPVAFVRLRLADQLIQEQSQKRKLPVMPGLPPELQKKAKPHPKYLSPRNCGAQLYHSHIAILADSKRYQQRLADAHTPLRFVEGEFKAESLTIHNPTILTIGLGGVWNWKDRRADDGDSQPLPELTDEGAIPLNGREVRLCFDSDVVHKPAVRAALKALAEFLHGRGARVFHEVLPAEPSGEKNGPDDLIYRHGPEAFHRIRQQPQPAVVMVQVGHGKDAFAVPEYVPPQEPGATNDSHRRGQSLLAVTARHWAAIGNRSLCRWTGTHWEALRADASDAAVQSLIYSFRTAQSWLHCDSKTISSWVQEWRRGLPTVLPQLPDHLQTAGVVPCSNGLLRLDTLELLPHNPAHGNSWCLQIPFDPNAPRGRVKDVLVEILGDVGARQVMAATAATIRGTIGRYKLFIEVFGVGDCGKSLAAQILQAVIGLSNTTTGTLERLEDRTNRFETQRFDGARLAVCNEAQRYSGPLEMLKALTGRDLIPAEVKNGELYEFTFDGLVLLIGNSPIHVQDNSDAVLNRRLQIGPLQPIPKEQQNPNLLYVDRATGALAGELVPHLPGFLLELLEIPEDQIQQILSTRSRTDQQLENEVSSLIAFDPVATFLERHLVFDEAITGDRALSVGAWRNGDPQPSTDDDRLFVRFAALCFAGELKVKPNEVPGQLQTFKTRIITTLRDQLGLPMPAGDGTAAPYKQRSRGITIPHLRWRTDEDTCQQGPISLGVTRRHRPAIADTPATTPETNSPSRPVQTPEKTKPLARADRADREDLSQLSTGEEEKKEDTHMRASAQRSARSARSAPATDLVFSGVCSGLLAPSDFLPGADGPATPELPQTLATAMVPASPPAQPPAPQPWHLIAIKLAAEGQHPATIRLHPDMPDNITGRQIADFLKQHLQEAAGNGSQHPAA